MFVISIQCSNYPCQMRSQYLKNYRLNKSPFVKGGRHLGKPSQIWISPNRGGGSRALPDPDFLHVKKCPDFSGGGGQGLHQFEFQILFR